MFINTHTHTHTRDLPPSPLCISQQGRQWSLAIDVFNHMVNGGIECDAVTCCSLITALDKGGQWQLAEQARHMISSISRYSPLQISPTDLPYRSPL